MTAEPQRVAPARTSAAIGFVLATLAIDALGFGIVAPLLPNLVMQVGRTSGSVASFWMGALLATFAAMQFICSPLQGGLSDRYGRRPILLLSLTGTCCNNLLLAWAPSLPWLFLGQVAAGATAASIATATAYIADVTPAGMRTQRFGYIGAAFALGFVLGPALGGLLGQYWIRLPLVVAAVLAGSNALYGLLVLPESLPMDRRRRFQMNEVNPVGVWRRLSSDSILARLAIAWCCIGIAFGSLESSFVLANEMRLNWDIRRNGLALRHLSSCRRRSDAVAATHRPPHRRPGDCAGQLRPCRYRVSMPRLRVCGLAGVCRHPSPGDWHDEYAGYPGDGIGACRSGSAIRN